VKKIYGIDVSHPSLHTTVHYRA